jgi:hypothetical protein
MERLQDQLQLAHMPRHPKLDRLETLHPHVHQHVPDRAREGRDKKFHERRGGNPEGKVRKEK